MKNFDIGNTILIAMFYSRIIGILGWSFLTLLLMEVILCKDAKIIDTARILNTPIAVRWRMFKKSMKSAFYNATIIIFFCVNFALVSMISDLWLGRMPRAPYTWTIVSLFLPVGIFKLYTYLGYQITLVKKFKLFMKNEHD